MLFQKTKKTRRADFTLDYDLYHKLNIIATVKKNFFDDTASMSKIVNAAIQEYFDNHAEEIQKMMDEYHEKGGLFYLEDDPVFQRRHNENINRNSMR